MKNNRFIMVMSGGPEAPLMFGDLERDERVDYLAQPLCPLSPFFAIFRKVHLATMINQYIQLPFRGVWDNSLALSQIKFERETQYHIVFINTSIVKYRINYLRNIKNRYSNIRYYLYMVDSVNTYKGKSIKAYLSESSLFTCIYSFDPKDCEKYNFKLLLQPLTYFDLPKTNIKSDIYFLGRPKGRLDLLVQLAEYCTDKIHLDFKIISNDEKEKAFLMERGWLSDYVQYKDNLNYLNESNVILELVQENQTGNTLRYQEAIMYNKKLLTNNRNVINLPFYNPNYIHVFNDVCDIDLDWIKQREIVDYGYQHEFSAIMLIEDILGNNRG